MVQEVILISKDGTEFSVSPLVANMFGAVRLLLDDVAEESPRIPLGNVESQILERVIEYCTFYSNKTNTDDQKRAFDSKFVKVDTEVLFDYILAANYMDVGSLLTLTCQTVADMIKSKTPEEIRQTFNIVNDFTAEEEDKVREENSWIET